MQATAGQITCTLTKYWMGKKNRKTYKLKDLKEPLSITVRAARILIQTRKVQRKILSKGKK